MDRGLDAWVSQERAVSSVLGVALMIAFAVSAAMLILVLSGSAVEDIEDQSRLQAAQDSLDQVANEFEQLQDARGSTFEFSFPEGMRSNLSVSRSTTVTVRANNDTKCTTGPVTIGTILYEGADGDLVGYEFGGVWRKWADGGSSMVSSPQVEYRNGRLALSMSQMESNFRTSSKLEGQLNKTASKRLSSNLSRALVTNKTVTELIEGPTSPIDRPSACSPARISNVTMTIEHSRFASAWHQYAHRNFDDERVEITPDRTADVESGDSVMITFKLRNTADSRFAVTDLQATDGAPADADVTVDATVRNVGDLTGTNEITFSLYDNSTGTPVPIAANPLDVETETLKGTESVDYQFTIPAGVTDENTEYVYSVDTGSTVENGTIQIGENGDQWPNFEVTSLSAPSSAQLGDSPTLSATVENTGDVVDTQEITFAFDGTDIESRTLTIPGTAQQTLTFQIPTRSEGLGYELNVSSEDDFRKRTIDIGDQNYFEVTETRAPNVVTTSREFEVNGSIRNVGELATTQTVALRVQNTSTGSVVTSTTETLTLDGELAGSGIGTINQTVTGGISAAGEYNYTIETANESVTNNIYVGTSPNWRLQASSSEPNPDPIEQNSTLTVNATIDNTGAITSSEDVEFSFDGALKDSKPVSLAPGTGTQLQFEYDIPKTKPAGTYTYTISTPNTTLKNQVRVVKNLSAAIGDTSGGTITIEGNVTARLRVLGTAPTAFGFSWYSGYYVKRAPVSMYIYTNNASAGRVKHDVWGSQDLNNPAARRDQLSNADWLEKNITVASGTNLSVFAKSWTCSGRGWEAAGDRENIPGYRDEDVTSYRCSDWGETLVGVDKNQNPSNLVILEDGEQVPTWDGASADQRSVSDVLQDKIDEDTGILDLEDDQRVMLYELTYRNARPSMATGSGDPDYNDAVVLFEVVNRTKTVSVKQDARFEITDVSAPSKVNNGKTSTMAVEVTNVGEKTNKTDVTYGFDGSTEATKSTGPLKGGESTTLTFELPPSPQPPGTYEYSVSVSKNPDEGRTGYVTVGTPKNPNFGVTAYEESYPRSVAQGSSTAVAVTISNVGDAPGTQSIDWDATIYPDSGGSSTDTESKTLTLSDGQSKVVRFDVPTSQQGRIDFQISTADMTASQERITVTTEQFAVDRVLVGAESYSQGETIVSTSLSKLSAEIENTAGVKGTQQVTFTLTNRSTGATKTVTPSVTIDGGEIEIVNIGLGSWKNAPGYYDYEVKTDDDSQTGTVQIIEPPSRAAPDDDEGEYISIDMNVISLT